MRTLILSALFVAVWSSYDVAHATKFRLAGTNCKLVSGSADFSQGPYVHTTTNATVICPIIRTATSQMTGNLGMTVRVYNGIPSGSVSCALQSLTFDGNVYHSWAQSATGSNITQDFNWAGYGLLQPNDGSWQLVCSLSGDAYLTWYTYSG